MHQTPSDRLRKLINKKVIVEFPDMIVHPQNGPMYLGTKATLVDFDNSFIELDLEGAPGQGTKKVTFPHSAIRSITEAESDLAVKAPIIMGRA